MSRLEAIHVQRQTIFKNIGDMESAGANCDILYIISALQELSETMAMIYDKMEDKNSK